MLTRRCSTKDYDLENLLPYLNNSIENLKMLIKNLESVKCFELNHIKTSLYNIYAKLNYIKYELESKILQCQ